MFGLRVIVAVCMCLVASGCAAPAPPAAPAATAAPAAATGKVELTFLNWNNMGAMKAAYDEYIAGYLAKQPKVSAVTVEALPFPNFGDVLNVRLSAKTPPNISWVNASTGPQYVKSGRLLDLTPTINATAGFNLADYADASLAPWKNGEKLVALPFTNASNVVFYNAEIFDKAGIPTPLELSNQGKWTWATMRDTAQQLTAKQAARYGLLLNNNIFTNGFRNLIDIYAPYGAAPWSDDGQTCTINSPQAVEATRMIWEMIYTDKSLPGPGVQADWTAGDIGMVLGRANAFATLGQLPFKWEIVSVPDGPNGFVPPRAQNGIAVWADAPNADLAAEFVVYTLTRENSMKFAANTPSPRKSLANLDAIQPANKVLTGDQLTRSVIKALNAPNFRLEYSHGNYAAVEKQVNQDFDAQIWNEKALARLRFPGRMLVLPMLLSALLLPNEIVIVPQYALMSGLGLVGSHVPVLLEPVFGAPAIVGTFLMRQFFLSLPSELEDAGRVDGLSALGVFVRIALPLSAPALATLAIMTFLGSWNAYLEPLVFTSGRPDLITLPVALNEFTNFDGTPQYALQMAATTLSIVPVAIVFLAAQRHIVEGIARSGLKG